VKDGKHHESVPGAHKIQEKRFSSIHDPLSIQPDGWKSDYTSREEKS
jgi:hypothetical protein